MVCKQMNMQSNISVNSLDGIELGFLSRCAWDWVVELPASNFSGETAIGSNPREVVASARTDMKALAGTALQDFWIVTGDQDSGGLRLTVLLSTGPGLIDPLDVQRAWQLTPETRVLIAPYWRCKGLWQWVYMSRADIYDHGGSANEDDDLLLRATEDCLKRAAA